MQLLARLCATALVLLPAALVQGCGGSGGSSGVLASTVAPALASLAVSAVDPPDAATGVPTDAEVRITFSGDVDAASVTSHSVVLTGPAGPVDAQLTVLSGGAGSSTSTVVLTPRSRLAATVRHDLRVTTAVADASGATLALDFVSSFATGPGPASAPPPVTAVTTLRAGAAAVDCTPPVGVPLGGFGEPPRRLSFPDLNPNNYHTFFAPSRGVLDPIMAKALVLEVGSTTVAIITVDAIATTAEVVEEIQRRAAARGVVIPLDNILVCSSHTHSGPGTLSRLHFWEIVGADLFVARVYDAFVSKCADALVQAYQQLAPATFAADSTQMRGISKNRRARDSNVFTRDSVDPELAVIRIDRTDGTPIATVWNYAVHGLVYWSDNMLYSADLFGHVAGYVERQGGGVCLFANGCEGDQNPDARGPQEGDAMGQRIATEILALRQAMVPTGAVNLANRSEWIDFGGATVSVDVSRLGRSNSGSSFVRMLSSIPGFTLGAGIALGPTWLEHRFRFQALRINDVGIASVPGEGIHTIGLAIKAHGALRGYRRTFVFGLANGHMSYITTPDEYDAGGYESIATFFGRDTGSRVVAQAQKLLDIVR